MSVLDFDVVYVEWDENGLPREGTVVVAVVGRSQWTSAFPTRLSPEPMRTAIALDVGGLLLALALAWLLFLVAMRTMFRPVLDRLRRMNRSTRPGRGHSWHFGVR